MAGGSHIVLTSIHPPTAQVEGLLRQPGWQTIFVADLKTPDFPIPEGLHRLSVEDQKAVPLGAALPWNHYARKNLGYLHAMALGAARLFDTDDDNLPVEPWGPEPAGPPVLAAGAKWINAYAHFGGGQVWPRGFPLERIGACEAPATRPAGDPTVAVWQGLVGGDPDVDAIFRLTRPDPVTFRDAPPLVLAAGSYCPFNSQNTLWSPRAFPYLYLPATVTFRFTDILRGLVAQRCFWAHGWSLGFQGATAWQERNPHDLLVDFRDELPCYLQAARVVQILDALPLGVQPAANLRACYGALAEAALVRREELPLVDLWLQALP